MRISMLQLLALASLALTCGRGALAQAPPTIDAELRKYGIVATQPSLRSALRDERPNVRGLAAGQLASMNDTASIPLIENALQIEKDSMIRFDFASALLSLHSQVGNKTLLSICADKSLSQEHRLDAASRLVDAGDPGCLSSVGTILRQASDSANKASALLILTRVKPIPVSLLPEIHNSLRASLRDPDSAVRQYSSQCIAALGDKSAKPDLQAAIAKEPDKLTRQRMEESLQALEATR